MNILKCILILFIVFVDVSAKIFSKCELAKELVKNGFPKNQLAEWICLIQYESNFQTNVVGGPNYDGSHDWGLFQINDKYWCGNGFTSGSCYINCQDLLKDDIKIAARCALKIYRFHGFRAWVAWQNRCQISNTLPNLSECDF